MLIKTGVMHNLPTHYRFDGAFACLKGMNVLPADLSKDGDFFWKK